MTESPNHETSTRPYFVPENVDVVRLPVAIQAAFQAIVEPCYEELVLGASSALERSAGATLCFLLCLEVLDQFEIAAAEDFSGRTDETRAANRDQQMARHLRLVGSKQRAENFLLRIRQLRAPCEPNLLDPSAA